MNDWLNQFTSSYASSIAYAVSAFILAFLFKPIFSFISKWTKQFLEKHSMKRKNKIALPTKPESIRLSTKQKVTKNEWNDAIEFITKDVEPLIKDLKDSSESQLLGDKFFTHIDKNIRIYQFAFGGWALIYLLTSILQLKFWQAISLAILTMILFLLTLFSLLSLLSLITYQNQLKLKVTKIKTQIRNAMEVVAPVLTYGQLGDLLKPLHETDLPKLQAELSDIGLSYRIEDLNFAHYLLTAPPENLLQIGEKIAAQVTIPPEQFANLSPERKKEIAKLFVDALLLWPVSLESERETSKKKSINKNAG